MNMNDRQLKKPQAMRSVKIHAAQDRLSSTGNRFWLSAISYCGFGTEPTR